MFNNMYMQMQLSILHLCKMLLSVVLYDFEILLKCMLLCILIQSICLDGKYQYIQQSTSQFFNQGHTTVEAPYVATNKRLWILMLQFLRRKGSKLIPDPRYEIILKESKIVIVLHFKGIPFILLIYANVNQKSMVLHL